MEGYEGSGGFRSSYNLHLCHKAVTIKLSTSEKGPTILRQELHFVQKQ